MSNDIIRNSVAGHFPAWYGTRVVDIVDWLCCHSSAFLFVIKLRCAHPCITGPGQLNGLRFIRSAEQADVFPFIK